MTPPEEGPGAPVTVVPAEDAEELYEHAPCGYMSTMPDGTVIRINQTLLSLLGYTAEELVGRRRFSDLLTVGGRIYVETHYAPLLAMQGSVRQIALDMVRADGRRVPVLVNSILVRAPDGTPSVIRTSVFDATDRREYERELLRARKRAEQSEARARVLAETLQASLIPPAPPAVPWLDIGAAYRPAGAGDEVGGDFYDVFETGEEDWAVVVGDVCGKGASAAAVTALARHTLRAAAMRSRRPSAVLGDLNEALLRSGQDRFCTVVYLCLRREGSGAVKVTVASGGHPLPLHVTPDGVGPVGVHGTLLGVLDEPSLPEVTMTLEPGHSLMCFTDGLVEARRGGEFFGDARLRDLAAASAGRSAAELVDEVIAGIMHFQGGMPRDDMAAVAVSPARGISA